MSLTGLYINAITPPPEVQQAIDDKSRMQIFDDMNKLMQMKTAMAMEKIAEGSDAAGGNPAQAGMGMGLGVMLVCSSPRVAMAADATIQPNTISGNIDTNGDGVHDNGTFSGTVSTTTATSLNSGPGTTNNTTIGNVTGTTARRHCSMVMPLARPWLRALPM